MSKGFLLLIFLFYTSLWGEIKEYVIRYQTLSAGRIFFIETPEGKRLGKITRELKNDSIEYSLYDEKESVYALGTTEKNDLAVIVSLKTSQGNSLGSFIATVEHLYPSQYQVYDVDKRLIASGHPNCVASAFTLADLTKETKTFARYFRPLFKLIFDYWHIAIEEKGIPDELLCVIGVFQTACDLNFERF